MRQITDFFWDAVWRAFLDENAWWIEAEVRDPWDPVVNPAR